MRSAQAADKKIVFPFGDKVPAIKSHAAGRYHGIPVINRLLHTYFLSKPVINFLSAIFDAVSNGWPAVILPRFNTVYLVASAGAKLAFPQVAGFGMKSQPLHISVAIAIVFGHRSSSAYKRVAGRGLALFGNAHNFSQSGAQVLGLRAGDRKSVV